MKIVDPFEEHERKHEDVPFLVEMCIANLDLNIEISGACEDCVKWGIVMRLFDEFTQINYNRKTFSDNLELLNNMIKERRQSQAKAKN